MPTNPKLNLDNGYFIQCVGTVKSGHLPYLSVNRHIPKGHEYVASGPVKTTKRDMENLRTFLRRSLEALDAK